MLVIGSRSVMRLPILAGVRTLGADLMVSLFSSKVEYNSETATFGQFSHSELLGQILFKVVSLLGTKSAAPYGLKKFFGK